MDSHASACASGIQVEGVSSCMSPTSDSKGSEEWCLCGGSRYSHAHREVYDHGQLSSLCFPTGAPCQLFLWGALLKHTEQEAQGSHRGEHQRRRAGSQEAPEGDTYPKGVSFTSSLTDISSLIPITAMPSPNYGKSHVQIKLCSSFRN